MTFPTPLLKLVILAALWGWAGRGVAGAHQNFLVIGVIASGKPGEGVVLLKSVGAQQAFAARVGQEINAGVTIIRATREFVYFRIDKRLEKIQVGEQINTAPLDVSLATGGLERDGNRIKVSTGFRDEILKHQLGKVMMQAAAVPHYDGSVLVGFRLWDIDPDSIYDRAGLVNGDIVTALNGQSLSDVGRAVQLLHTLKDEARIEIDFIRKRKPMSIEVVVE